MITSTANPHVKYVRSLHDRHTRLVEQRVPVEGLRLLEEVLRSGCTPDLVFFDPEAVEANPRAQAWLSRVSDAERIAVSDRVLRAMADTTTPQGIVAVVPLPQPPGRVQGRLALVLDGLQDPGNVGTILRTAEAAEVETVLASQGTVDAFSAKVVRAGMGAQFRLGLLWDQSWEALDDLTRGRERLLAVAERGIPFYEVDWSRPVALIVGSEAHGAGPEVERLDPTAVSIPMREGVESLNAAVAAGVLLFEAVRQARRG